MVSLPIIALWTIPLSLFLLSAHAVPCAATRGTSHVFPYFLQWKRLIHAHSGPIASSDSLVMLTEGDGAVLAVDRWTGIARWRFSGCGPVSALQVHGKILLFADLHGNTGALNLADGAVEWINSDGAGPTKIASDGRLTFLHRPDGWTIALRTGGVPEWRVRTGHRRPSVPLILGDTVYVGTADGALLGIDAASGQRLRETVVGSVVGALSSARGFLVAAANDGYLRAWNLALSPIWERRLGAKVVGAPWVGKRTIVCSADNDYTYGVDPTTGDILWKYRVDAKVTGQVPSPETNQILVATESGFVSALEADSGQLRWCQQIADSPVRLYGDGHNLYAATGDGYIYAFERWHDSPANSDGWVWHEIRHSGFKTGFSKRLTMRAAKGLQFREEIVNWSHGFVRVLSTVAVDLQLRPMYYRIEKIEEHQRLVSRGEWLADGKLRREQELSGQRLVDTLDVPADVLLPETVLPWLAQNRSSVGGVTDTLTVFDYAEGAARPLYATVAERINAEADSLEVIYRPGPLQRRATRAGPPDLLPRVSVIAKIDLDGGIRRMEIPVFESMTTRVSWQRALAWEPPTKPPSLKVDQLIPNLKKLKRLVLRLPPVLAEPDILFLQGNRQQIERDSLGMRLVILRVQPKLDSTLSVPIVEPGLEQYLDPSLYVQSNHPRVRSLSARITGSEHNAQTIARRLMDWVYDHMTPVDTNVRFKSTLEVLDDMRGTCSEYTVLYAALCRAAGIPSRVSVGFVPASNGDVFLHIWAEVFLGEWVDVDPSWGAFPVEAAHIKTRFGRLTSSGIARMNLPLQLILSAVDQIEVIEYETDEGLFLATGESLYKVAEEAERNFEEERAQELYHQILLLPWHQRSAEAHVRIARYHLQRNRLSEAEWPLRRLLQLEPSETTTPKALFYFARIAEKRGQMEKAREQFQRVVDFYPRSDMADDALMSVADIVGARSGCRRARPFLERLIEEFSRSGWAAVAMSALEKCGAKERRLAPHRSNERKARGRF